MKRKTGTSVIRKKSVVLPCGCRVRYSLLRTGEGYGICLEKLWSETGNRYGDAVSSSAQLTGSAKTKVETVILHDVSSDYATGAAIYRMLSSGGVTPLCVYEVMEEYFARIAYA